MKRERIIADVENTEDARKVEETVKTGYIDSTIETIVDWTGVEEDLASSYEGMAAKQSDRVRRDAFLKLADESKSNMKALASLKRSFEDLDKSRIERINALARMNP
jgi:hypothetical protein